MSAAGTGAAASPILAPIAIGSVTAANRVLFGPHETNLCHGRAIGDAHVAYYERRARGGCGIVVTETASVLANDWPYERAPLAADCAAGWEAVARSSRAHGTVTLAALGHCGGQGSSAYSQEALWAPSRFTDPASRETPQVMELEDVASVVDGFATAARIAAQAGVDGVEVNAGTRSLLRQFLSGLTNTRDDDYGTDRLRLAREVLLAVRAALGPGPVLGLRLGCDELAPWAGITPEASVEIAAELAPLVDYIVAVRAPAFNAAGTRPDGHTEEGFALPLAAALREALDPSVVVGTQGSVVDVAMASSMVVSGAADLVEMTRAQIADPDLVVKVGLGTPERVRPCVLCNQRCQVLDVRNPIVSCIGEPSSGYEGTEPSVDLAPGGGHVAPEGPAPEGPASDVGRASAEAVLVVGGGPAGLEAARVAAGRGHRVRLVEARDRLGGWVRAACQLAGQARLARLVDWLEAECARLGVEVQTGTWIAPSDVEVALARGERVVLCTGSVPGAAAADGDGSVPVITAAELLGAAAGAEDDALDGADAGVPLDLAEGVALPWLPEGAVVVEDLVGDSVGVGVAERLAAEGRTVSLVTGDLVAGTQLSRTGDLAPANARLAQAGVTVVARTLVTGTADGNVVTEERYSGAKGAVPAAALVVAGYRQADESLASVLGDVLTVGGIQAAGDAVSPRTVAEAVLEGRRAALALEGAPSASDGVSSGWVDR